MTNYPRALYYLYSMHRRAYWDTEKLERYQSEKLRRVVRSAYEHVPFYKRQFRELGIDLESIKNRHDLHKLPILRKSEIKRNLNEMISKEFDTSHLRMLSTSGSTGEPLFLYVNGSEMEFRKAKHLRSNISCGQKPWDRWITLTGPQHASKTTRLQRLIRLYEPITVSVFNDVPTQISLIEKLKPNVLDGYSSSLLLLAQEIEKREIETIKPKFVISGAELMDAHSKDYIQRVLHVPVYDQYSSVEFDRMAWQCKAGSGYHIDYDALIIEFLDKNGEEVSAGETGEIVVTSLFNYAMPMIRYAIGDVGAPSDDTCECGRTLPLMKMVEGRKDSLIRLPNGQVVTPRAFTTALHAFEFYDCIEKFRVVQKKLNLFQFILKVKENCVEERVIETALVTHLRNVLKLQDLQFETKFVNDIPLDKTGKLMAVVSELAPNNSLAGSGAKQ